MKKPTSAKQIAANQSNAAKSTGPRTARGRAVSKLNALKHGILSREVVVRGRVLRENGKEFEAIHRRFREDLEPEGPLEEMLVDQIVTAHWRLRRALAAESGEIALGMDAGERKRRRGFPPAMQWTMWRAFGDPAAAMEESSLGNSILIDWLRELRDSVKSEGALTAEAVQTLAARLGGSSCSLVRDLETFRLSLSPTATETDPAACEAAQVETLAFLDRRIATYRFLLAECVELEDCEEESRRAAAMLPSVEVLDKIMRYETKLERQIHRAMAQLERLQRIRRGESIPAPLSIAVSERG